MIAEPTTAPSRAMTPASMAACSWASPRPASTAGRSARRAAEVRELPLLRLGRRRAGGGLPPLPALPARDRARPRLLARHRQHGEPRAGLDRRRRARRRGLRRRDPGRAAGRRRPPAAPPVPAPSRRLAHRRRPDAARAVRQAAPARHPSADGRSGAGLGLRQRAPLQRDVPRPVRPPAQRAAPQGRRRQFGPRRRDAAARLPPALRLAGHAGGAVVARGARTSNGSTTTPGIAASISTASRAASRSPICRRAIR